MKLREEMLSSLDEHVLLFRIIVIVNDYICAQHLSSNRISTNVRTQS